LATWHSTNGLLLSFNQIIGRHEKMPPSLVGG
jgi:hypothetical protein